jgi:hypothetical protein
LWQFSVYNHSSTCSQDHHCILVCTTSDFCVFPISLHSILMVSWDKLFSVLLAFRVSAEKSVILLGLPLYMTWQYSCSFQYSFFVLYFWHFNYNKMWRFFFCSGLFWVLNASYTWMSISVPRFGNLTEYVFYDISLYLGSFV